PQPDRGASSPGKRHATTSVCLGQARHRKQLRRKARPSAQLRPGARRHRSRSLTLMQRADKLMYQFAAHTLTAPLLHALTTVVGARSLSRERILMLGRTPLAERIMREAKTRAGVCGSIVGVVDDLPCVDAADPPLLGPIGRLSQIVDHVRPDRIVVALTERRGSTPIQALLESCLVRGIVIEEAAQYYERLTGQLAIESLTPTSIVFSGRFPPSAVHEAVARVVSLLVAGVGFVCSLP